MRIWKKIIQFLGIRSYFFIPKTHEVIIHQNRIIDEYKIILLKQKVNHQYQLQIPNIDGNPECSFEHILIQKVDNDTFLINRMVFMGDLGWKKVTFLELVKIIQEEIELQDCKMFFIKSDFRKAIEGNNLAIR